MQEVNVIGQSANHHSRNGSKVPWFCLHTEEGPDNRDPWRLHKWMINNGVSYHYVAGNDIMLDVIDTDLCSWSALDANPRTINLVFAGSKAGQSRQTWLDKFSADIDNAALIFVQDAKKYNPLDTRVLGQDYASIRAGVAGAIDHSGITYGLGIGTHTDVGKNFPWDFFAQCVLKHLGEAIVPPKPVEPPRNAINDLRATPGFEWLGDRVDKEEVKLPDGVGRMVAFSAGAVYWHPSTGAVAIPAFLFAEYAAHGYERGIGYPINNHAMLPGGEVQGFENGTLYRQYGKGDEKYANDGFWVHGAIMDAYRQAGYENGKFGWPISEELPLGTSGSRVQDFEHGRIIWSPQGVIGLRPNDGPDEFIEIPHQ